MLSDHLDEAFVEISFSGDMPDYEVPYDEDEDNNYSIYRSYGIFE